MKHMRRVTSVGLLLLFAAAFPARSAGAQIDLSGEWSARLHEDRLHRRDPPGPDVGDYTGLPINDAARHKAESWDASVLSLPERQAIPASALYGNRGAANLRISKVVDDATQQVVAFKLFRSPGGASATRMIWMDGRPHPPEYAAHTFQGFSTGRWEGNMLTVRTTHVKMGFVQRNGVPHSDQATMTEHFIRHGDTLTVVSVVDDPAYLEEPLMRSSNWALDLTQELQPFPFEIVEEIAGRPEGYVPHYLPGANTQLTEFAEREGLPFEATRGGKATTYPEYQVRLKELMATTSRRGTQPQPSTPRQP
jgi:hypothetical protein